MNMNAIRTYYLPPIKSVLLLALFALLLFKVSDVKLLFFGYAFGVSLFILLIIPESYTFAYDQTRLYVKNRINIFYYKEINFDEINEVKVGHESYVGTALIIILKNKKKHVFPSNFVNSSHKDFVSFFNSPKQHPPIATS